MYRHYLETETIQILKVGNAVRVKVKFLSSVAQFLLAIVKHQLNWKEEGSRTEKKSGLYWSAAVD